MIKKTIFFFIFLNMTGIVSAQEDNSQWSNRNGDELIAISGSGAWRGTFGFVGSVGIRYSQFISNKIVLGGQIELNTNGKTYKEHHLSPFLRLNFLNGRLYPFVEIRYQYGSFIKKNIKGDRMTGQTNSLLLGTGVGYKINKKFTIELFLENPIIYSGSPRSTTGFRLLYKF